MKYRETFYRRHTALKTSCSEVKTYNKTCVNNEDSDQH